MKSATGGRWPASQSYDIRFALCEGEWWVTWREVAPRRHGNGEEVLWERRLPPGSTAAGLSWGWGVLVPDVDLSAA